MAAPIKTDIIYYCTDSDFELEFNLGGCCSMRLLSDRPKSKGEFLKSLGRAVSRSQIIFVLGALDGENPVIQDLSAAINYSVSPRDLSAFGIQKKVLLPERSIPLVTNDGVFGGCVVECGPQSIVILTDDRDLRRTIMRELVHDYVRDFDRNSRKTVKKPYRTQDTDNTQASNGQSKDGAYPYMLEESEKSKPDFKTLEKEFEEKLEPKPRTGIKRFFTFLFILLFIFVGVATYIKFVEPIVIDRIYNEYREMYGKAHALGSGEITDNLGKLYAFNSDTVGYLEVHGTDIAYPIVSDIEKSENYYQKHLYNGWYSYLYGTPYTVNDIKNTKYHRNILIFGKDSVKGTMFSSLADIKTLSGYHSSHTLRFDTLYNSGVYKIFAAFECEEEDLSSLLKTEFWNDGEFAEYVTMLRTKSEINTTVDVVGSDEIITLITYGKENSTIVVARRVRNGESSLVDTQGATENLGNPVIPEANSSETQPAATVADENIPYKNFSTRYEQGEPLDSQSVLDYTSQYAKPPSEEVESDEQNIDYAGEIISVTDADTGERISGTVLDILCRVVEAEMGSSSEPEAIKAQAIASYGWLMTNGAWDDGAPSIALKTASSKVITEVKTVIGLKPYINGHVAQTMYFPCSAGYTVNGNGLFGTELGYGAKDSSFDRNCNEFIKYYIYSANDIKNWVYETTGIDLSAVSDKERWIHTAYDQNGAYVSYVWFGNNSTFYSGRFVREKLLANERTHGKTLASTAFKVSYQPESDTFIFETRGVGHGVGMSQYGANALAKSGKTYIEILSHYFDGITIEY